MSFLPSLSSSICHTQVWQVGVKRTPEKDISTRRTRMDTWSPEFLALEDSRRVGTLAKTR